MGKDTQPDDEQPDGARDAGLPGGVEQEVERFLGRLDATREFLDDLQTQQVQGRDAEVREQLRQWAGRKPGQFAVTFHTLVTGERFRRDVEVNFGTKVTTVLTKMQEQYASLRSDIFLIRLERVHGLYRSGLRAVITDVDPAEDGGFPVVSVEYREGASTVVESQQEPSQALGTAANLTQAVAELLTEEQDDWSHQHPAEQRAQQDAIERLRDAVERLPDVEDIEVVDGEVPDSDEPDTAPRSRSLLNQDDRTYRERDDSSDSETPTYIQ